MNARRIQRGGRATSCRALVTEITLSPHGNCTGEMRQTPRGNGDTSSKRRITGNRSSVDVARGRNEMEQRKPGSGERWRIGFTNGMQVPTALKAPSG